MKKILLAGYYGFGNLGDELLAETAREILQPDYLITILKDRRQFWSLLRKNDYLMFAGGSLFQDVTGKGFSLLYYSFLGFAAKLLGKKLFLVAQGIGPINCPFDRWVFKHLLKAADFISVRDKESAVLLQKLGCTKYRLATDLLFATNTVKIKKKIHQQIVVNLRPFAKFQPGQGAKILRDYQPLYVPLQNDVDYGVPVPQYRVFQLIAGAKLAVGMRLHFLILALLCNVPAVGIVYDPKVENLCRKFQLPFVRLANLQALPALLKKEQKKLAKSKQRLKTAVLQEKRLAQRSVQVLLEALNA